jgi:hypothetical protein
MITDVHRPRLLAYAATLAPLSKAGDVARQLLLTADIRGRPAKPSNATQQHRG